MGQGGVGKTAMVLRWTSGEFPDTYMPTIGDMYTRDIEVRGPRARAARVRALASLAAHGHIMSSPPVPQSPPRISSLFPPSIPTPPRVQRSRTLVRGISRSTTRRAKKRTMT